MNETVLTALISIVLIASILIPYVRYIKKKESVAKNRFDELKIAGLHQAVSMHPVIDVTNCIGCGACTTVCPEGDVLGIIEGKATLIHGAKCVGHGRCAEACPVGAIELLMAKPSVSASLPVLSETFETSVPGVYIVGELGGLGLIRNAVEQAKKAIADIVAKKQPHSCDVDVVIVGAGPSGLTSGLGAIESGLSYMLFEQEDIGGAILHYPRSKVVMTNPVMLPVWGKLHLREVEKEKLLGLWMEIIQKTNLQIITGSKVNTIVPEGDGFRVSTNYSSGTAKFVILALGRRGTPRKLGVPGEELPKVMYRLIDTASYNGRKILVVGGGNSAIEAAVGLGIQKGNTVTLSYRQGTFNRISQRNQQHLDQSVKEKRITLALETEVAKITPTSVILTGKKGQSEIPNDEVFIFAGGEMPFELLRQIGVDVHSQVVSGPA
jgi:thioredoxin reductase/NAD-dependent dihydropyrimidine dehydrogenase PreA subunit